MQTLKNIRLEMGYTVRGFAELLGFDNHSTYQHYESGRRPMPQHVLEDAKAAHARDRRFFNTELPASVDANLVGGVCPNEARP